MPGQEANAPIGASRRRRARSRIGAGGPRATRAATIRRRAARGRTSGASERRACVARTMPVHAKTSSFLAAGACPVAEVGPTGAMAVSCAPPGAAPPPPCGAAGCPRGRCARLCSPRAAKTSPARTSRIHSSTARALAKPGAAAEPVLICRRAPSAHPPPPARCRSHRAPHARSPARVPSTCSLHARRTSRNHSRMASC